ncbi:putative proteasome-type protease [Alteromonadaceae bacterium 2753L.S.0a.02]|nr:putative proteasome-type protease [Alteromonadaceae bacterium 2753L.S.0a.02]
MTYCLAISVNEGLVFCSDTRTNAGPDMLSSYSKMHIFRPDPDRKFCVLSAGNLATTQAIVNQLEVDLEQTERNNLLSFDRIHDVAAYVTEVSRNAQMDAQAKVGAVGIDASASLLFGGQMRGGKQEIYLIYSAGNFIAASIDTPFLQIGESKYGKPILDRVVRKNTPLEDAARCALVSMDSTIKSNATVGPPIEVLICEFANFDSDHYVKLDTDDAYLVSLRNIWDSKLKEAFASLPKFDWEQHLIGE